jgi:hypothetical protein
MAVPGSPTGLTAVSEVASVDLSWIAPSTGAPLLGYNVYEGTTSGAEYATCQSISTAYATCSALASGVATCADLVPTPVASLVTGTSYVATGLTNGTPYYFVVTAINATGPSFPTTQATATPALQAPGPPIIGTATPGNGEATVTWTAPTFNGGSAVTGYTVTSNPGGVTASAGASATSVIVTGLTNYVQYTFTVTATNAIGTGPPSAATTGVTPEAAPGRPFVSAVAMPDPLSGDPIVVITVVADTTGATSGVTMTTTVLRDDGTYVIGASPTNALAVPSGSATATIVDRQAAYGVPVTYTATVLFSSSGAPYLTQPSLASVPVVMGQAPATDTLYSRLGWAQYKDTTGVLHQWLAGIGGMMQVVDSLARDGFDIDGNPAPGWSQALDINRAPTFVLPWLGQFVGVRFDPSLRDDQQRYLIENAPGFARGTPAAIVAAANQYLLAGYTATLIERDTSPYHLAVSIPSVGVRGTSTCGSLVLEYATCSAVEGAFATCADLWNVDAEITAAIEAALPGGLVAVITYV